MSSRDASQRYARLYSLAEHGETRELLAEVSALLRDEGDEDAGNWALIAAAEANQTDTVAALLGAGANPNGASVRQHIKPLWKAAKRGNLDVVKLLLASGADPFGTDNLGMTALDCARRYSRADVVAHLESLVGNARPGASCPFRATE